MELTIGSVLAVAAPAVFLWLAATLEVAFRSTGRLELRRWAQTALGARAAPEPDAVTVSHRLEVSFISVRLTRQLALICLAVGASGLMALVAPAWGWPGMLGLTLVTYLVADKVLPFVTVASLGPLRVLALGKPVIALARAFLGRLAALFYRLQRGNRAREEAASAAIVDDGDLDAFLDLAEEEGLVSKTDEALLRGVADFGEAVVREVMTPRVDVLSVDAQSHIDDLRRLMAEHKLSRLPVVRGDLDTIEGIVHIKDLVTALEEGRTGASIAEVTRPAMFVPETKRIRELLEEFQRERAHMAMVVDEYGGTAGLVTLEDVLEEIVGEIQDEYEDEEPNVLEEADGCVVASGKAEVEEVERMLDVEISDEEFETVGGMAFAHLGYVPRPGEEFEVQGLHVEVLEADDRRVRQVRIRRR